MDKAIVLLVLVAVVALGLPDVSGIPTFLSRTRRKRATSCTVSGVTYTDGQKFKLSSPCIEYQCDNGRYKLLSEGCTVDGICRAVNSTYERKCHKYTCLKSLKDGYSSYSSTAQEYRCTDKDGQCFDQGEIFSLDIQGNVYDSCKCQEKDKKLQYSCGHPKPSGDCTVDGKTIPNGQTFSRVGRSPCFKYLCTDGRYTFKEGGCHSQGKCYAFDQDFVENCHDYTCKQEGNTFSPKLKKVRCTDSEGVCHDQGETFSYTIGETTHDKCTCNLVDNTLKYSCSGGSGSGSPSGNGDCTVNNATFPNGQTFHLPGQSECVKFKCTDGQARKISEGCKSRSGDCHDVGSVFEENCHKYTCTKIGTKLKPELTTERCVDADKKCHDPGDTFPFEIGGKRYETCSCSVVDSQIKYKCSGGTGGGSQPSDGKRDCNVNGGTYSDGKNFTLPGQSKCFVYLCTDGQADLIDKGCEIYSVCYPVGQEYDYQCHKYRCIKDGNNYKGSKVKTRCTDVAGVCHEQGENFSFAIDGKTYDSCTCNMEGDKLRYSCVGGGNEGSKKCIVEGVTYENGQKFSIPGRSKCFMYQCANGKANTIQEGCEVDGECRDVGSTFLRNPCDTYKCIKEVKEDANYFKASIINRRCEDSNGKCHSPGDVFSKRIGSVVYNNCSCTLEQKHTKYRCYAPDTDGQPKDCDIGGITYPDGKMFALPGQSMCLKYLCTKGVVSVAQEACEVDGACVPLNSISDDGCSKFKCIKEDGNEGLTYRSEQSEIMCRDVYGNSQPLCTEFYHGIKGKHYPNCTCTLNETGQIDYSCVDAKCEVDGRNYGHGERFVVSTRSHCVKYLCWHGGWDISQGACEINGDCYPADAEFQIDCKQYKCATVQKNGIDFFEAQLIGDRDECQDKDGTCQSPGEVFSKVVDSKTYTKCTCKVELDHSFYHCTSANGENEPRDCVVDGKTHKDGAVFTLNGQSPCLKFRCSDGDVDIDEEGCEHKGECKPVGSQVEENCERSKCLKERGLARWVTTKFLPCNTEGSD